LRSYWCNSVIELISIMGNRFCLWDATPILICVHYMYHTSTIIIYHEDTMHTVDTIMASISNLRVHIAPVGFEVDRIVIPAEQMRADKVWLLVHENPSEDKAGPFIQRVTKKLKKSKIPVLKEYHNRLDLFQIIKSVRKIIEKEQDNLLYVNLSSGSKIQAIALMMACMMFNQKKKYHSILCRGKKLSRL